MTSNLLWADDDCNGLIASLGRLLQRKGGFVLRKATNYTSAMEIINDSRGAEGTRIHSLLVDIILPHQERGGALDPYLGLTLAERSVTLGVKVIGFLTVVRLDEVIDRYTELVKANPAVKFTYFDKTTLLEKNELDVLITHLSSKNE